jgi:hypothetical protein
VTDRWKIGASRLVPDPDPQDTRERQRRALRLALGLSPLPPSVPPVVSVPSLPREPAVSATIPQDLRERVFRRDGGRCVACGVVLDRSGADATRGYDCGHLQDRSAGGPNTMTNLVALCAVCNRLRMPSCSTAWVAVCWLMRQPGSRLGSLADITARHGHADIAERHGLPADLGYRRWKRQPRSERARAMERVADVLRAAAAAEPDH